MSLISDWTDTTTTTTTLTTPTITWDSSAPITITWNPATSGYIQVVPQQVVPQFNPAPPSNEMLPWDEVEENDFYVPAKRAINVK